MTRFLFIIVWGLTLLTSLVLLGCGDNNSSTGTKPMIVGTTWHEVRTGSGAAIDGLTTHDSLMVAVGEGGAVYTSSDGASWEVQREYGPGAGYLDVAWGLGQFVAVGLNGDAITSSNGIDWARHSTEGTTTLRGVAASDEHTMAVGSGAVYSTEDNDLWTDEHVNRDFYDVVYNPIKGHWVLAGAEGSLIWAREPTLADTVNFIDAYNDLPATMTFKAVVCTDSFYYAAGVDLSQATGDRARIYYSSDGHTWYMEANLPAWDIEDLFWTGDYFIAVGEDDPTQILGQNGIVLFSEDGAGWTKAALGSPLGLRAVGMIDSLIVAAGDHGYFLAGTNPDSLAIVRSGSNLTGVVRISDRYMAVSDRGTSLWSTDGVTWHENPERIAYSLSRLAWSGSKLVSLGGAGVLSELYTSSDGTDWAQTHDFDGTILTDVCYGSDRFVAVGYFGAVMTSLDGEIWTNHDTGDSSSLQAVIWDGSHFVAATAENGVYTSVDGASWSPLYGGSSTDPIISRLCYGQGRYVAVGNSYGSGSILEAYVSVSTDAATWNVINLGALDTFYDIIWTDSHYVICGKSGQLCYSTNGTDWTDSGAPTTAALYDLATGTGQAIAVGSEGTVLVSP